MAGWQFQNDADLASAVSTLKQEVDALQIASKHYYRPWYKDGAVFVAGLAFIFSLGTTAVSYIKGEQQLRQAERRELRELTLRLGAIPRELFEFQQKYYDNAQAIASFSGLLNSEQQILAKQASEIISRIPHLISAGEHINVGNALTNANLPHLAEQHFQAGVETAKDADEIVSAYRFLAHLAFLRGDFTTGRQHFQSAKTALESGRVPVMNSTYIAWSNALTDIRWAQTEAMASQCEQFDRLLKSAANGLATVPEVIAAPPMAEINDALARGCPPRVVPTPPSVASTPPPGEVPRPLGANTGSLR